MARPRLLPRVVARVRELLGCGLTQRQIVQRLVADGHAISVRSVKRIACLGALDPELAPGETRLAVPIRCEAGHLMAIAPCRTCTALAVGQLASELNKSELRRAARVIMQTGGDPDELLPELPRAARARLVKIRARKIAAGEIAAAERS